MDAFSLIIGGVIGGLAGWAFSSATSKQREANKRLYEASRATAKMSQMKGEAKTYRERGLSDSVQGFLFHVLGFAMIVILGAILISSFS